MRLLRARDWVWLLAIPFYVVLATFRHEGSHAVVGAYLGAEIEWFQYWPRLTLSEGLWTVGRVIWDRRTAWVSSAAPYLLDLLLFAVTFISCLLVRFRSRALWMNLIILGIVSSFINSLWNYLGAYGGGPNDVSYLLGKLPGALVHSYFLLTLTAYATGFFIVVAFGRTAHVSNPPATATETSSVKVASPGLRAALRQHGDVVVAITLGLLGLLGEPLFVSAGLLPSRAEIRLVDATSRCNRWLWGAGLDHPKESSETYCQTRLDECRDWLGEGRKTTIRLTLALANYYKVHGRSEDASELLLRAIDATGRFRGEDHPLHVEAIVEYVQMLGGPDDYEQMLRWSRELARRDHPHGYTLLGWIYEFGTGVDQDIGEAAAWYRKGAQKGDPFAQTRLADLHRRGEGVAEDAQEAAKWYRLAAEGGSIDAQKSLADMYRLGEEVSQDYEQTAFWFGRAADQGDARAQYSLARLYQHGDGVPKDDLQAALWFRKAAIQDHAKAQYRLGDMAQDEGRTDRAYVWFKLAADNGSRRAQKELAACTERLTLEEIDDAQHVARVRRLETSWRTRGGDDARTLREMESLGRSQLSRGNLEAAEKNLQELLDRRTRLLGEAHRDTLSAASALATCQGDLERSDEAEALFRRSLKVAHRELGEEEEISLMIGSEFAGFLIGEARFDEAEALLARLGEVHATPRPGNSPHLGSVYYNLGRLEAARGHSAEALTHLRHALDLGWGDTGIFDETSLDPLRGTPQLGSIVEEVRERLERTLRNGSS